MEWLTSYDGVRERRTWKWQHPRKVRSILRFWIHSQLTRQLLWCKWGAEIDKPVYWLHYGWPGFNARDNRIFVFATPFTPTLGRPILLSSGLKRLQREANHSPHLERRLRMHEAVSPLHPPYVYMALCRDNFTFAMWWKCKYAIHFARSYVILHYITHDWQNLHLWTNLLTN
jgi:hypothetical protein